MAEKLGLKMGRANLDEFAATLMELAKANPNIVAVTSDSRGSGKLGAFGHALPKQLVEVGRVGGVRQKIFWRFARMLFDGALAGADQE
jgi:hypothetical protein